MNVFRIKKKGGKFSINEDGSERTCRNGINAVKLKTSLDADRIDNVCKSKSCFFLFRDKDEKGGIDCFIEENVLKKLGIRNQGLSQWIDCLPYMIKSLKIKSHVKWILNKI